MQVSRLQLRDFRNYRELEFAPPAGKLLLVGDNAQGKSNLMEAVYLLASARSGRAAHDSEMIAWQVEAEPQPVARVAGVIQRRAGEVRLEAAVVGPAPGLGGQAARAGKRFRVNGIPRRAVDFVGNLHAVLFTAEDMQVISGAPSDRRRFLDLTLSRLERRYHTASQRYARVLQQRNAGLKRVRDGLASSDEMTFWDETLVKEGAVIVALRLRYAARLAELAWQAHAELSGDAAEALGVAYEPRLDGSGRPLAPEASVEEIEERLTASLRSLQRREVAAGQSLVGPHRDDVVFEINGVSAAAFASRAQVRTATLAVKLAEARLLREVADDPPVLLLDDIVSELDEGRRRAVLAGLADFDQVWLTATDWKGLPGDFLGTCSLYRVRAGEIAESAAQAPAP